MDARLGKAGAAILMYLLEVALIESMRATPLGEWMRNLISFVRTVLAPVCLRPFRVCLSPFRVCLICVSVSIAGTNLSAQATPQTTPPATSQDSSSQALAQGTSPTPIVVPETIESLKYDNRWEVYVGIGYERFKAGPNFAENSALGGFDVQGTRWFTQRLGATANARGYYGTSPATPNTFNIRGPFVSNHMFMAGPELLGPHNIHAAITLHALAGGAYGRFNADLGPYAPGQVGLFNNGFNFAGDVGATLDLNRSPHIAFRIAPDMLVTRYGGSFAPDFGISVGFLYRFNAKR
jgi:hypothetical protein